MAEDGKELGEARNEEIWRHKMESTRSEQGWLEVTGSSLSPALDILAVTRAVL